MDLKIDRNTGTLVLENGDLALTTGLDRIVQFVSQKLKFFRAEWFLDIDLGIPYFDEFFQKNPDPASMDGILKDEILSSPGILGLETFELQQDTETRLLDLKFQARSTEGTVEFTETVG